MQGFERTSSPSPKKEVNHRVKTSSSPQVSRYPLIRTAVGNKVATQTGKQPRPQKEDQKEDQNENTAERVAPETDAIIELAYHFIPEALHYYVMATDMRSKATFKIRKDSEPSDDEVSSLMFFCSAAGQPTASAVEVRDDFADLLERCVTYVMEVAPGIESEARSAYDYTVAQKESVRVKRKGNFKRGRMGPMGLLYDPSIDADQHFSMRSLRRETIAHWLIEMRKRGHGVARNMEALIANEFGMCFNKPGDTRLLEEVWENPRAHITKKRRKRNGVPLHLTPFDQIRDHEFTGLTARIDRREAHRRRKKWKQIKSDAPTFKEYFVIFARENEDVILQDNAGFVEAIEMINGAEEDSRGFY